VAVPGTGQDVVHAQRQVLSVRLAAVQDRLHLVDAQRLRAGRHLQRDEHAQQRLLHRRPPATSIVDHLI